MPEETWEDLPPPLDLTPPEGKEDTTPEDGPLCPTCNLPIQKEPHWARMHKYHDGCQPTSGSSTTPKRTRVGGKAEKEADRCEEILRDALVRTALAISVVDKYDAFCIMANMSAVCSSFRSVCLRYPPLRKEMLRVPEGGSVIGLLFSVALMAVPMAAHHGLIPSARVSVMLAEMPVQMWKLSQRVKEGEDGLKEMMREQVTEMQAWREQRQAKERAAANGQHIPAS